MKLKANLHFHCDTDPDVPHSFYEGVDRAAALGFHVLALTCHNTVDARAEYERYASERGILFIPGVERTIDGRHVLILNPGPGTSLITSFEQLGAHRARNPQCLVVAPHPYFYGWYSLHGRLDDYAHLFDAVEHSWFYSKWFNRNVHGEHAAARYHLPLITTSDTHDLSLLDASYAIIEAKEQTIPSVFEAIQKRRFKNVTAPQRFWSGMVGYMIRRKRIERTLERRLAAVTPTPARAPWKALKAREVSTLREEISEVE